MKLKIDNIAEFLKPKKPLDIFERVSRFNAHTASNKIAVRLINSAGYMVDGFPITNDSNTGILYDAQKNNISYIDIGSIVGVEIKCEPQVAGILTDDAYFEIPSSEAPSRLELKRKLKEFSDTHVQTYGFTITTQLMDAKELDEKERHQFCAILEILSNCIVKISADDLGQASLKKLKMIRISSSTKEFTVFKHGNELTMHFNLNRKIDSELENSVIKQLESKF